MSFPPFSEQPEVSTPECTVAPVTPAAGVGRERLSPAHSKSPSRSYLLPQAPQCDCTDLTSLLAGASQHWQPSRELNSLLENFETTLTLKTILTAQGRDHCGVSDHITPIRCEERGNPRLQSAPEQGVRTQRRTKTSGVHDGCCCYYSFRDSLHLFLELCFLPSF